MSSFALFLVGVLIVVGGLAYVAFLLHVPPVWIVAGAVVMVGLGLITAVTRTRQKDGS